ncbi:MAG: heme o synthase [Acidobacteriia bacterium]|nr:heme o synthase [Terriglobia bacterium]
MSTPEYVLDDKAGVVKLSASRPLHHRLADYYELTKPSITFLVVLSAAAGFAMGNNGSLNYWQFIHTLLAIGLLSSGLGTLNQYYERDLDGLMKRTTHRPLPQGRIQAFPALIFGVALCVFAEIYLAVEINALSAVLGLFTLVSYLFVYTPLKTRTPWCTFLGAFPGAMPPLVGWVAARDQISWGGWVLFGILFLWQFPHFHSIAMLYREDYQRAGIRMLPVVEDDNRATSREILIYTLALFPLSLAPSFLKMSGTIYLLGAVLLGLAFIYFAFRCAREKTKKQARFLLLASVFYLPLLFGLMVLNPWR